MPHESVLYSGDDISSLVSRPESIIYFCACGLEVCVLSVLVWSKEAREVKPAASEPRDGNDTHVERWHAANKGTWMRLLGKLAYPTILATFEGVFTLLLKGLSTMMTISVDPENPRPQWSHVIFITFLACAVLGSLAVLYVCVPVLAHQHALSHLGL